MEDDVTYGRTVLVPKESDIHRCESVAAVHRRVALGGSIVGLGFGLSMLALFVGCLGDNNTPIPVIVTVLLGALGVNFSIAGAYFYHALDWLSRVFELVDKRSDSFTVLDTEEMRTLFKELNAKLGKIVRRGRGREAARLLREIAGRLEINVDASELIDEFRALARD